MPSVRPDSAATLALLTQVQSGEQAALDELLRRHRADVRDFVRLRLDTRLQARLDPSDVVQDAQMEVARRIDDYLRRRPMPFHLWIRKAAYERLLKLHRDHCKRAKRSVKREEPQPTRSSLLLARSLAARSPSPSRQLAAREFAQRVADAIAAMPDGEREILLMRQVDEMPYEEIACVLDIETAAARKRYGRALIQLQARLFDLGLGSNPS